MTAWRIGGLRVGALAVGLGLALGACSPTINNYGFVMDEDALEQIRPGGQNREQVAQLLGSPSSVAVFDSQTGIYSHHRTSQRVTFLETTVLDQDVIAIT